MNKSYFSINSKAILWARIVFGIALLFRVIERLSFLGHFSQRLPGLYSTSFNPFNFGLVSGNATLQYIFYTVLIGLTLNFIKGKYLLRTTCLLIFALSHLGNHDGIYVGNGLRIILPMLLMWSLLPKVVLTKENLFHRSTTHYYSKQIVFLHFFLSFIYLYTFLLKTHPVWRETGEALNLFLMSKQWMLGWTDYLLNFPNLLKLLSFGSLALELCAVLIFCLGFNKWRPYTFRIKFVLGISFILFHFSIGVISILHVFSLAMISCWILILPSHKDEKQIIICDHAPLKLYSKLICGFLLISLIVWNVFPKHLKNKYPLIKTIRTLTLKQHWGLLSPAPGFSNYQFELFRMDGEKRKILYTSVQDRNKKNIDAFLTAAMHTSRLLNAFGQKYCSEGQKEIWATYKRFSIDVRNQTENFHKEKVIKIDCSN